MEDLRCAILGSTGMMGQRFIQLLDGHPYLKIESVFSSEKRLKRTYGEEVKWHLEGTIPSSISDLTFERFDPENIKKNDIDLIFSALPNSIPGDMEMEASKMGIPVFSNSSTHRFDENVPILIPEINGSHLDLIRSQNTYPGGFIVTNPNCSTSGLVMALEPLVQYGISNVYVSTYQALSGAGYPGLSSLSMIGNVIPYIENEEEKMKKETNKILGEIQGKRIIESGMSIHPSCARVPVRDGHLISVHIEMKNETSIDEIKRSLLSLKRIVGLPSSPAQPIILSDENDRPQPLKDSLFEDRNRGMSVTVGRIRKNENVVSFFVLVNNTIRGGAGNAILTAELAHKLSYLGGGRG